MEPEIKINKIFVDLPTCIDKTGAEECQHFTIRGYVSEMRKKDWRRCCPFPLNESVDESPLPPLEVPKYRRWCCENCRHKAAAEATRGFENRQQEISAGGIGRNEDQIDLNGSSSGYTSDVNHDNANAISENQEASITTDNILERTDIDLNKVIDLGSDSDSMLNSDEKENHAEIISRIAGCEDNGVSNVELETSRLNCINKSPPIVEEDNATDDDDDKPKKMRFLYEVMGECHDEATGAPNEMVVRGGLTSKKKGGRGGRKRKSLVEENRKPAEAQHHASTENEMNRLVEDSFAPSSHQYGNPLPFPRPFQEGTSRSGLNIGEDTEHDSFQELNIPLTNIEENTEPTNKDMTVEDVEQCSKRDTLHVVDDETTEVAPANNLQEGSPPNIDLNSLPSSSMHEQKNEREFDLNLPCIIDLDEEPDSNDGPETLSRKNSEYFFPPKHNGMESQIPKKTFYSGECSTKFDIIGSSRTHGSDGIGTPIGHSFDRYKKSYLPAENYVGPTYFSDQNLTISGLRIGKMNISNSFMQNSVGKQFSKPNLVGTELGHNLGVGGGIREITSEPLRRFSENYYCRHNRNPADFTAPVPGNPYMIDGEDLEFEWCNHRKRPGLPTHHGCNKKRDSKGVLKSKH